MIPNEQNTAARPRDLSVWFVLCLLLLLLQNPGTGAFVKTLFFLARLVMESLLVLGLAS